MRELLSRAVSLLLTQQDCAEVLQEIYKRMTLSDQNSLHGRLLVVLRTLRDRERLLRGPVEEGSTALLSHLLLSWHLERWWIGGSTNPCAITRSLYLEILNALLELVGGVAVVEGDETRLQLCSLYAHSLDVCRSSQHAPSVFQHVRLLVTALQCPSTFCPGDVGSHDLSHDPSHVSEVVLGVLAQTKEPEVVVYVLKNSNLLEGEGEEGDDKRVLKTLVLRALEDCDPDILVVVLDYMSGESVVRKLPKLNELVTRAYQMFLETHNRIEVRVVLIRFLTSAVPLLQPHPPPPLPSTLQLLSSTSPCFHCPQGAGEYTMGLLTAFQRLVPPTYPQQIRQAVAAGLTRLWPLALKEGGSPLALFCRLVVQLLQDTDSDVRDNMAASISALLGSVNPDKIECTKMSCSSALKFFITLLPQLVKERSLSFQVLLHLLPEAPSSSDRPPYQNPLFDEDPLNDYAEDLVVMEQVVSTLKALAMDLTESGALSLDCYSSLSEKVLSAQFHAKGSLSQCQGKDLFLCKKKAELLSPLLKAIAVKQTPSLEVL